MRLDQHLPRVVLVTRKTEYQLLLERHGTRKQARFFLDARGQSIETIEERDAAQRAAVEHAVGSVPHEWRRARVDRGDLDRFLFEDDDVVVAVGQDGLVANVAKYLTGQPVVGINPAPALYEGVLVPHAPQDAGFLIAATVAGEVELDGLTMVEAELDDGQRLLALNEIYVGQRTHQSSRYRLIVGNDEEEQSSSGVIVATGTGASGWARSIHRERRRSPKLPQCNTEETVYFVREAWPSVATGCQLTAGRLGAGDRLQLVSRMEAGVLFGDGIEADCLQLSWGRSVTLGCAEQKLRLVRAA